MSRNARNQKYKTLDKLINAGFTDDKQIAELKFKDIAKIKGLTKQDISSWWGIGYINSHLWKNLKCYVK